MEQGKIIAAYKTLAALNRKPGLPFSVVQKLFQKKKELEPFYQMQTEQEIVIIEASGQTLDDYKITPELKKELFVLSKSDVIYDGKPVDITVTGDIAEKLGLTAEMLEYLDGFVTFTEG